MFRRASTTVSCIAIVQALGTQCRMISKDARGETRSTSDIDEKMEGVAAAMHRADPTFNRTKDADRALRENASGTEGARGDWEAAKVNAKKSGTEQAAEDFVSPDAREKWKQAKKEEANAWENSSEAYTSYEKAKPKK